MTREPDQPLISGKSEEVAFMLENSRAGLWCVTTAVEKSRWSCYFFFPRGAVLRLSGLEMCIRGHRVPCRALVGQSQ